MILSVGDTNFGLLFAMVSLIYSMNVTASIHTLTSPFSSQEEPLHPCLAPGLWARSLRCPEGLVARSPSLRGWGGEVARQAWANRMVLILSTSFVLRVVSVRWTNEREDVCAWKTMVERKGVDG